MASLKKVTKATGIPAKTWKQFAVEVLKVRFNREWDGASECESCDGKGTTFDSKTYQVDLCVACEGTGSNGT